VCAAGSRLAGRLLVRPSGAWDRGKMTRGGGGAAPVVQSTRGAVFGEVTGKGDVGRLGERTSTERTPAVRRPFW
jgi:hypothetical protein